MICNISIMFAGLDRYDTAPAHMFHGGASVRYCSRTTSYDGNISSRWSTNSSSSVPHVKLLFTSTIHRHPR